MSNKFKILFVKQKRMKKFLFGVVCSLSDRADGKVTDTMNVYCIECLMMRKLRRTKKLSSQQTYLNICVTVTVIQYPLSAASPLF